MTANDDPVQATEGTQGGERGLRRVDDARALRALAHPVRLALMEVLVLAGPLTATEAGERIGESATTCSFHLRQLARYDFVEEAGGGKGRARPWRVTSVGLELSGAGDAETEVAQSALTRVLRERYLSRYATWVETQGSYPAEWRGAAGESEFITYLTPDELQALNRDLQRLLFDRFPERLADRSARPEGSLPVELLVFSYPVQPPVPPSKEG